MRDLSKNSQLAYSKYLERLSKVVDLDKTRSVEEYVLGIDCSDKSRTYYLIASRAPSARYCLCSLGMFWVSTIREKVSARINCRQVPLILAHKRTRD